MAYIYHDTDETLHYVDDENNTSSFLPIYDTSKSYDLFETIINDYLAINPINDKITKAGFNLLPVIYEDLHWHYCFNYIKYKNVIDKYGLNVLTNNSKQFRVNGYDRVKEIFIGDTWFTYIINVKKLILFIIWITKCLIKGKTNKVWVDEFLLHDFRYDLLKNKKVFPVKEKNILRILNKYTSLCSFKYKPANLNEYIEKEIHRKTGSYRWWLLAIKILKPKRIIVKDNLFNLYSILLAANICGVEIIGVSHGAVSFWHRGQFGSKHIKSDNQLKYNKYYVWDESWEKIMLEKSYLYSSKEVFVSGWLKEIKYNVLDRRKFYKYVLYPNTAFTDYNGIKSILSFFEKAGYIIIIKGRSDISDYSAYKDIKHELVEDFTNKHFENALCVVASSTTMIFDLSVSGLPVVIPEDGMNFFYGICLKNWFYFNENSNLDLTQLKKNHKAFIPMPITNEFKQEFEL